MVERLFAPGEVIVRREVLDGREWLVYPVRVVAHDAGELAVYAAQGTPLTFGQGEFSLGPHPWQAIGGTWQSEGVLQVLRPGDGYSVWRRSEGGEFAGWYVNFQRPMRCWDGGFDTLDQELDLLVPPAPAVPAYRWKDEDEFEHRLATGGFAPGEAEAVRADAAEVAVLVEKGECWWERWREWRAPEGWTVPASVPLTDSVRIA